MTEPNDVTVDLHGLSEEDRKLLEEAKKARSIKKTVTRVIKGENDLFIKDYNFEEIDLQFSIKIRFPNILEQAQIQTKVEQYFGGVATLMAPNIIRAYRMLATIHVCGKEVPSILQNDDAIYNLSLLDFIAKDFQEWMDTFQY